MGGVTIVTIRGIINSSKIKKEKERLKAEIVKIKIISGGSVTIETILRNGEKSTERLESNEGISSDIFEGQIL